MPAREVLDGVLVIFGGALLLTPGFITDILGLFLLIPPSRAVVRALLVRRLSAPDGRDAAAPHRPRAPSTARRSTSTATAVEPDRGPP